MWFYKGNLLDNSQWFNKGDMLDNSQWLNKGDMFWTIHSGLTVDRNCLPAIYRFRGKYCALKVENYLAILRGLKSNIF